MNVKVERERNSGLEKVGRGKLVDEMGLAEGFEIGILVGQFFQIVIKYRDWETASIS